MRLFAACFAFLILSVPALAQEAEPTPHPCTTNPELESCVALAAELAEGTAEAATETTTSLKEALVENAPLITARLNEAMLKVGTWVEATEDFAKEQTPLLVGEIIFWAVAAEAFWVVTGALLFGYGVWAFRWTMRNARTMVQPRRERTEALQEEAKERGDRDAYRKEDCAVEFMRFFIPITGGAGLFIGFLCIFFNVMDMVKPLVAPRLYLIEYFRALVS